MDHKARLSEGRFTERPVHGECSCGVAGDFHTELEASNWFNYVHFSRRGPTEVCELVSNLPSAPTPVSASAPATPLEPEAGAVQETVGDA